MNTPHIPDSTLKDKMGNYAIKEWQFTVQQSCKNIPCFSTCCKGEISVQILNDDGEDLKQAYYDPSNLTSYVGKEAVYKAP